MKTANGELLILTTVAGEVHAADFARGAVERRLAACVSVLPKVTSRYFWESEVMTEDEEVILLLKTHRDKLPALEKYFEDEHPYEVPEFLVFAADGISEKYANWMRDELRMGDQ